MIISRSELSLRARHEQQETRVRTEHLHSWVDPAVSPTATLAEARPVGRAAGGAELPPASRTGRPGQAGAPGLLDEPGQPAETGPDGALTSAAALVARGRLGVLLAMVERLTGRRVELLDPAELNAPAALDAPAELPPVPSSAASTAGTDGTAGPTRVGWGVEYQATEAGIEQEALDLFAEGTVTTADGRNIAVDVELAMRRTHTWTSQVEVLAGDAVAPVDPLVLSRNAVPSLSGETVELDLDADGTAERVAFAGAGSAFLALDRDGNGRVDDGRELFGPTSGDGFAELAAHDDDGNGWIDEADAVYSRLRLWSAPGAPLTTLAEAGVGAIGLARVDTPFTLTADGATAGMLRSSGVWLAEDGGVGTVHQVDLVS